MVENTERTRQVNTRMNLKHRRRYSETPHTHTPLARMTSAFWPLQPPHDHISDGHDCAVHHRKGTNVEVAAAFSTVTDAWTHSGTKAEPEQNLAAQSHNLPCALSALNHEPDYYSISWDIKLIMLVCVTWFARSKQQNCGYWKTSNIRPFPHAGVRQETVIFHLTWTFHFSISEQILQKPFVVRNRTKLQLLLMLWVHLCFISSD